MSKKVGMIGLGNMGYSMITNLGKRGFETLGFDTVQKESCEFVKVVNLETLCSESDVILLSLPNSKIIEKVVLGNSGIIGMVASGKAVIDLSSADPVSTKHIYGVLKEKGIGYLDAAVSGGKGKAANGTLAIMVGGDRDVYENHRWVLENLGSQVFYMGESGLGDAMKAVNNYLNAVTLAATSEAMIVAKKMGLDLEQALDVINRSSGRSYATEERFPRMIKGDYMDGGLSFYLMIKDLEIFRACAQSQDVPLIMGDITTTMYRMGVGTGIGNLVQTHIVDIIGDLCGGIRLYDDNNK